MATNASAIVANVTGVDSRGPGFLTVSAARLPRPPTSNVNMAAPGGVVPNHIVSPITATHGVQVYSSHGAHVLIDLAGYFTGTQRIPQLPPYINPAPPAAPPNWILQIPRLGLTQTVMSGDPKYVTDSGRTWHWTGTGYMGQGAHVAVFGHRTEAGGYYRYIDSMVVGDTFTVTTGDRREYTYRMVRRDPHQRRDGQHPSGHAQSPWHHVLDRRLHRRLRQSQVPVSRQVGSDQPAVPHRRHRRAGVVARSLSCVGRVS